ncbi:MAG: hypothetical protein PHD02_01595 [Bacilli bacterium]|nr:hypothetical protein [Bacilli bacterium]
MNQKTTTQVKSNPKSKFTEDTIPVRSITNGMIVLENNEKVTGVKIQPRNIFITDPFTQNAIIDNLKIVYNTINYEFWLIVADRPVDIQVYISELQMQFNKEQNPARRKIILEDLNKCDFFIKNDIVDTEYYLLFKDKDTDSINKKIRNLITHFANAGLTTQQTSNDDLRIILDNFLNSGMTTTFGTVGVEQ